VTEALRLSSTARRAFTRMGADLQRIFGARFVALVASGPRSSVAFARTIASGDLEANGPLVETWQHEGVDTPLLLTPDEFTRSLDAFPLEYQAILDRHLIILGQPPFDGVTVDPAHLRRACEVQAKSHLLHLRQGWLEAAGHPPALAALIARSAEPLAALLANVARLDGRAASGHPARTGAELAGLSGPLVQQVLAAVADPDAAAALVPRLAEYLSAAERLWAFIDAWQGR
jgi:hypothetical protein